MAPKLRENDNWSVGQLADGSINIMTEEEARIARAERDAEEAAFDSEMEEDLDDISDLEDEIPAADEAMSVEQVYRAALDLDELGYLEGLKTVRSIPDKDVWNGEYDPDEDEIILQAKWSKLPLDEQLSVILHEAGHRAQYNVDEQLFYKMRSLDLNLRAVFLKMANKVHQQQFTRAGYPDDLEGEVFAESYARYCLGMPMPEALAQMWAKRARQSAR